MSSKNSRHTPSPSPSSPPLNHAPSKLPKFLQKQNRDRSKSVTDPGQSTSSLASGSSASASPEPTSSKPKKGSKFLSISKDNHRKSTDVPPPQESQETDEPPVIVEPISIPRPRTRSERPAAPSSSSHIPTPSLYASTSSTSRIGDLPTRLSGWFTHTFSTSSTDLSLPTLLAQHSAPPSSAAMSSPKGKSNALLTAAKHGKGHLDKAMRYLLDSDAVPDKCTDPIWLLGVQHPGYEEGASSTVHNAHHRGRRTSISPHPPSSPPSFRSSTSSVLSTATTDSAVSLSQSTSTARHSSSKEYRDPSANWPPAFYLDFTSRIWLTYRSHFGSPIKDSRLGDLEVPCLLPEPSSTAWDPSLSTSSAKGGTPSSPTGTPVTTLLKRPWGWGGEKTWNSDSGWGCMLRTGQSLLANALISVKLGRDWRCPPHPIVTADYATYVQILTWFLDTPNPEAPFSVHRMALAGKELGTDVGQWFGPSVAAGAIRTLVNSFPDCGLAVSVAIDSTLYRTEVYAASHGEASTSRSPRRRHTTAWGDRPVLLLLGIRLGIEGVNPIYYETIKQLYTFPQSVGIAGGRPSSSYYFVGSQADNLFYLDPHNTRSAIPLRPPPPQAIIAVQSMREQMAFVGAGDENYAEVESGSDADREREKERKEKRRKAASTNNGSNTSSTILGASINTTQRTATPTHQRTRTPTSPSSVRTGSSNFSYHAPVSPSPLQHQFSNSSADSSGDASFDQSYEYDYSVEEYPGVGPSTKHSHSRSPPPSYPGQGSHGRWRSSSANHTPAMSPSNSEMDHRELGMFGGSGSRGSTNNSLSTSNSNSTSNSFGTSARTGESGSGLDLVQLHYCTAYSAAELKTFHCERVRKMPLSGLDPSMLIGFLCRDEADWWDFKRRVGELPRTIFSVQEEPPTWPSDSDDNMGLESISEPDDIDLDEDGVEVGGRGEGDESDNDDNEDDGDGDNEQFFDTQSSGAGSGQERSERGRSDVDTEEDSVDPVTPGPGSRFDVPPPPVNVGRKGQAEDEEDKGIEFGPEDGEGFEDEGNDIEDDWIDPSLPTPTLSGPSSSLKDHRPLPPQPTPVQTKDPSPSPPSSSNVPPLAKGKSSSSSKHASSSGSGKRLKKTHKQIPVPVPAVRLHSHYQQQQQEHYPFPVTTADDGTVSPNGEKNRSRSSSTKGGVSVGGKRMHTARARDGGRTQSGGVKGILTDE